MEDVERVIEILKGMRGAVVALSGGVDSAFLLKLVGMSGIRALAVTSASPSHPEWDLRAAAEIAALAGVPHKVIRTHELENPEYSANGPDRCYHCKNELFAALRRIAEEEGLECVLDGSTADDLQDYRPGLKAARAHGVRSPLMEAGFGKDEIRLHSRRLGLPTWAKPSSPCLSSRIPYGTPVTEERLRRIFLSEAALRELGLKEFRVRDHGTVARLEVSMEEFRFALGMKDEIVKELKKHFKFISLDLEGFRSGSLNGAIDGEGRTG